MYIHKLLFQNLQAKNVFQQSSVCTIKPMGHSPLHLGFLFHSLLYKVFLSLSQNSSRFLNPSKSGSLKSLKDKIDDLSASLPRYCRVLC